MPSPFPGMDPYLEDPAFWADFHRTFLGCWREAIADALPPHYDARLNETVNLVQMSPEVIRTIYPDIAMSRGRRVKRARGQSGNGGGTLLLEPVTIPHELLDEVRQGRVEILHRSDRRLVTVLEMLSPFNKTGDGLEQYRNKRKHILLQKVHLVELDLLIGGRRLPHGEPLPPADYYGLVSRVEDWPNVQVYGWTVRDPLPSLPIPLRAPDPDVRVDLAKVFRAAYKRGRYAGALAYGAPPTAPLKPEDQKWAQRVVAKETRRR
jgi:hypothetical protein